MFLMGHSVARYACLLAPLTPLTCSTALRFARSLRSWPHSIRSLPCETVDIREYKNPRTMSLGGTDCIKEQKENYYLAQKFITLLRMTSSIQ